MRTNLKTVLCTVFNILLPMLTLGCESMTASPSNGFDGERLLVDSEPVLKKTTLQVHETRPQRYQLVVFVEKNSIRSDEATQLLTGLTHVFTSIYQGQHQNIPVDLALIEDPQSGQSPSAGYQTYSFDGQYDITDAVTAIFDHYMDARTQNLNKSTETFAPTAPINLDESMLEVSRHFDAQAQQNKHTHIVRHHLFVLNNTNQSTFALAPRLNKQWPTNEVESVQSHSFLLVANNSQQTSCTTHWRQNPNFNQGWQSFIFQNRPSVFHLCQQSVESAFQQMLKKSRYLQERYRLNEFGILHGLRIGGPAGIVLQRHAIIELEPNLNIVFPFDLLTELSDISIEYHLKEATPAQNRNLANFQNVPLFSHQLGASPWLQIPISLEHDSIALQISSAAENIGIEIRSQEGQKLQPIGFSPAQDPTKSVFALENLTMQNPADTAVYLQVKAKTTDVQSVDIEIYAQ